MHTSKTVIDGYSITSVLVDQPTATLYEAKAVDTDEVRVLKIPHRNCSNISDECSILCSISHPNIIQACKVQTADVSGFSMPFAFGGDLLNWIQTCPLDEDIVKGILFNILQALVYLHTRGIWHRDIKPENLLVMDYTLSPNCVVLSDFGFARHFPTGVCDNEFPGSVYYAAPELLLGLPYNEKVDIWALGITAFACLTGTLPFDFNDEATAREQIINGLPTLFTDDCLEMSDKCRDLLDWMLTPDPEKRPSAKEALQHAWFQTECKWCENQAECAVGGSDAWETLGY
jgi:serine/threonine protein kinase